MVPAAAQETVPGQVVGPPQMGAPAGGGVTESPDRFSPMRMLSGPSVYETGRVGAIPEAESTAIEPQEQIGIRNEKTVKRIAAGTEPMSLKPRPGTIDQGILEREIRTRFADVEGCRVDVARTRRINPAEVTADRLTLRWTIQPGGDIVATTVVATAPVDLEVMDCIKGAMSRWTFSSPIGGPVEVERAFTFHALR
jgi:hypothetical protein